MSNASNRSTAKSQIIWTTRLSTKAPPHHRLLRVQTVFGLVEYHRMGAIDHGKGLLVITVGRQCVNKAFQFIESWQAKFARTRRKLFPIRPKRAFWVMPAAHVDKS